MHQILQMHLFTPCKHALTSTEHACSHTSSDSSCLAYMKYVCHKCNHMHILYFHAKFWVFWFYISWVTLSPTASEVFIISKSVIPDYNWIIYKVYFYRLINAMHISNVNIKNFKSHIFQANIFYISFHQIYCRIERY